MNDFTKWHNETLGCKTVEALKKNGFEAVWCSTAAEAKDKIMELIPEGTSVGLGGSWTVKGLGLPEALAERGNTLLDHGAPGLTNEERLEIRKMQLTCDVFLTGTNAVTMNGELVNTDGVGNRVAAMIFGPGRVIVVMGANKIVKDLDEALERIERVAAPINNKRLGTPNPCTQTGLCMNCQGPTRICNITTVLWKRPKATNFHVILVGDDLGF